MKQLSSTERKGYSSRNSRVFLEEQNNTILERYVRRFVIFDGVR